MAQFKVGDRVRFNAKAQDGGRGLPWFAKYFGLVLVVKDFEFSNPVVTTETGDLLKWEHGDRVYPGGIDPDWLEPAPPPALIDPAKTYQTRDGRAVRIYAVDGGGAEPIHGAVQRNDGEWYTLSWEPTGAYFSEGGDDSYDLVEVKPEHTRWIIANPAYGFNTQEEAQCVARDNGSFAVVKVKFREGDGL